MRNLPPDPDLMDRSCDAMARGDHDEAIRLAQESNRQMTAYLDEKHSVPPAVCDCDEPRLLITAWTCPVHGDIERRP